MIPPQRNKKGRRKRIRYTLVAVFGVLPATFVAGFFGSAMFLGGVTKLPQMDGVAMVSLALGSIIGTVSLWVALFKEVNGAIATGLGLGMIAIGPFTFRLPLQIEGAGNVLVLFWFGAPFLVATWLLSHYLFCAAGRRLSSITE